MMKPHLPKEIRFLFLFVILALGLVAGERLSALWLGPQTLAPLLAVLSLGIIAIRFSYRFVMLSILPFAVLSYWLISDSSQYPFVRTITVILAGGIACWASFEKDRLSQHVQEFDAIIRNLPLPWLLSDPNGITVALSPLLAASAGKTSEELVGIPYSSLLAPADSGEAKSPIEILSPRPKMLQIHPFFKQRAPVIYRVSYLPVVILGDHCLLIVLKED
jgi:PAS domain-containing protein